MDSSLAWLASLPDFAIYGIIGVISSLLVALIFRLVDFQRFADRWHKGPLGRLPLWVPLVAAIYVMVAEMSEVALPWLHAYRAIDLVEKSRLVAVIFQYHPEAKSEARSTRLPRYRSEVDLSPQAGRGEERGTAYAYLP